MKDIENLAHLDPQRDTACVPITCVYVVNPIRKPTSLHHWVEQETQRTCLVIRQLSTISLIVNSRSALRICALVYVFRPAYVCLCCEQKVNPHLVDQISKPDLLEVRVM